MSSLKAKISYLLIRALLFPIGKLPLSWIRKIGRVLGSFLYYTMGKYRKRTLSNLSLASSLQLKGPMLRKKAKQSLQNLAIIALEYGKFAQVNDLSPYIRCKNPNKALSLSKKGTGIVFFCGHQANWEVLFLDGTSRMPGAAIAKQAKNPYLYNWIVSIREKYGGEIIEQKKALQKGLKKLQAGYFLGILADQADPDSSFSFPFFGRKAKQSLAPAILSYRSRSPMIVATTKRASYGYEVSYSDPIWPDRSQPLKKEALRMMKQATALLENSIQKAPEDWLWQHNKYKQQNKRRIKPRFRHEAILFLFDEAYKHLLEHLPLFRKIYPESFFFLCLPKHMPLPPSFLQFEEVFFYEKKEEMFLLDYRFKCVFNFSAEKRLAKHFLGLSALEVLSYEDFVRLCPEKCSDDATLFKKVLLPSKAFHD